MKEKILEILMQHRTDNIYNHFVYSEIQKIIDEVEELEEDNIKM